MKNNFLKKLKILLVEDEKRLAELFKNAIGDSFYKFYIADNGEEGLQKFTLYKPDIIITDIIMPFLSGLEMAKAIRTVDKKIPIIILSAHSQTDKFLDAIDIGVVKYFIKPYDPDELLDYISSMEDKIVEKIMDLKNGFSFKQNTNTLYKNKRYIALTKKENTFIQLLLQEGENFFLSHQEIKEKIFKEDVSDEAIRAFIKRLRVKTSQDFIVNVKGLGYRLSL